MTTQVTLTVCSACGRPAVIDGVCGSCGFASGEDNRCPHCEAVARVEPKGLGPTLRWVCGVCGGPRMPGAVGGKVAMTPLREAKASEARATRLRVRSWSLTLVAVVLTLVAPAGWSVGLPWGLFVVGAIVSMGFALKGRSLTASAMADANEALDRAWLAAAEDLAGRAQHGITVAELAERLKIDPARAERLLSKLAVGDRTRIDVGEDAEVRYSVAPADASIGRVRVDDDDRFRALDEAEAASRRDEENEAAQRAVLSDPFPRGPRR